MNVDPALTSALERRGIVPQALRSGAFEELASRVPSLRSRWYTSVSPLWSGDAVIDSVPMAVGAFRFTTHGKHGNDRHDSYLFAHVRLPAGTGSIMAGTSARRRSLVRALVARVRWSLRGERLVKRGTPVGPGLALRVVQGGASAVEPPVAAQLGSRRSEFPVEWDQRGSDLFVFRQLSTGEDTGASFERFVASATELARAFGVQHQRLDAADPRSLLVGAEMPDGVPAVRTRSGFGVPIAMFAVVMMAMGIGLVRAPREEVPNGPVASASGPAVPVEPWTDAQRVAYRASCEAGGVTRAVCDATARCWESAAPYSVIERSIARGDDSALAPYGARAADCLRAAQSP